MRVRSVERKLAAILAADVVGYSRLMGEDEAGTLARLKEHRRELIDPKISEHKGRIVKTTGDGILIEFPSVVEAVACAVAVQRGMAERNAAAPEAQTIVFRVGVNLGDIIIAEDNDIHGDGVNVAARLEGIAEPGGICISGTVRDHIGDRLDLAFEDMGEQSLKNIARPVRVYRVRATPTETITEATPTESEPAALALPDKPSIAVLPFQNMSGDPEQEYFADGMVEEIITALSRIRWFLVIARNSTFTYKGRAVDVKQVGRELGVRYVLEGSVRKSGSRIRVTAQLIEAETGSHLWAERYDRDLADIFTVQDEITECVVTAIEPELYAAEYFRSQRKQPEALDAWECVIQALSCVGQATQNGLVEAEMLCRRAVAVASGYGQAHGLLAWVLARRVLWAADADVLSEAAAEAQTALRLDERDPWAHMAYAVVMFRMRRYSECERAIRRALEFNPNFALGHAQLCVALTPSGAYEEAVKSAEHALRLSPSDRLVDVIASFAIANAHFAAGHYEACVAWARKTIEKYPENPGAPYLLIAAAAMQGDIEAAAEALADLLHLQPDFSLASLNANTTFFSGEPVERLFEGLRRAGAPEA